MRQLAEGRPAEGGPEGNQGGVTEGAEADGNFYTSPDHRRTRSHEEFLEETRLRRNLVKETRDQFRNLSLTPRSEDHQREPGVGTCESEGEGNHTGVGATHDRQNTVPPVAHAGHTTNATGGSSTGPQTHTQPPPGRRPGMASKQKLPEFTGDGKEDPLRHYHTCETIWSANGVTNQNDWVQQFLATLRGVAIDWYSDVDKQKVATWANLQKEFTKEFRLLHDDNEIVTEIYSTKQGTRETVRAYSRRLKELLGKMESQPAEGLKKRWFVEGLKSSLRKKLKIVPPTSYDDAYNRAMDLESEYKTSRKKKSNKYSSDDDEDSDGESSNSGESSKKVHALQKDMERMLKEFKAMKGSTSKTEENDVWCTDCRSDGHTKGSCPKKAFCDICQIAGHFTKECPYNMKTKNQQVLFTKEQPAARTSQTANNNASPGGYWNNWRGGRTNNNKSRIQYDAKGRPMIQC